MWTQTLFSKKTRSLRVDIVRGHDEFHFLNDAPPYTKDAMRGLIASTKRHRLADVLLFIERVGDRVYCGVRGEIAFVLKPEHEFSREADLHNRGELGREITFLHAYDHAAEGGPFIPDIDSLLDRQETDLLYVLTEAHQGKEPVPTGQTSFEQLRRPGTSWDEIARAVEAGTCRGGFFSKRGDLLERMTDLAPAPRQPRRGEGTTADRLDETDNSPMSAENDTSVGRYFWIVLATPFVWLKKAFEMDDNLSDARKDRSSHSSGDEP